jgi:hypothetical protein
LLDHADLVDVEVRRWPPSHVEKSCIDDALDTAV